MIIEVLSCDYAQRGFNPLKQKDCAPKDIYKNWKVGQPFPYYDFNELAERRAKQLEKERAPKVVCMLEDENGQSDSVAEKPALEVAQRYK